MLSLAFELRIHCKPLLNIFVWLDRACMIDFVGSVEPGFRDISLMMTVSGNLGPKQVKAFLARGISWPGLPYVLLSITLVIDTFVA